MDLHAMVDWLEFLGAQPGFDQVRIGEIEAVKVPTYEAIYLAQRLAIGRGESIYIEPTDGEPIQFPEATPSIRVREIKPTMAAGHDTTVDQQINPLLAPSFARLRETIPEFFEREEKYITKKRYGTEKLEGINQAHRVCLSASSSENEFTEGLTEYLVSMYLRRQGYIVDDFNGGLPGRGGPDLYAIALPEAKRPSQMLISSAEAAIYQS